MEAIILIFGLLFMMMIRIMYVNSMVDDWNSQLKSYITHIQNAHYWKNREFTYYKRWYLKPWKFYFKFGIWRVERLINNYYLHDEVRRHIKSKYSKG